MEDNDNNNGFSVDTEELKNEAKDTVNQVRDTIKNANFKEDAEETKGFLKGMLARPFETIKRIASGEENILSKIIVIMIIFTAASILNEILYVIRFRKYFGVGDNLLSIVSSVVNPLIYVLVPSILVFILNKKNKKSLITVVSTIVITSIPAVINRVLDLLITVASQTAVFVSPFQTVCTLVGAVLGFYGMKELFEDDDIEGFIKKYACIKLVAAFVFVILGKLGIY